VSDERLKEDLADAAALSVGGGRDRLGEEGLEATAMSSTIGRTCSTARPVGSVNRQSRLRRAG
jgi:hypothetical protein